MEQKLTLTNSKNKTIDLMDDRHLFAEISDFGFSLNNEYQTIGTNFLLTNSKYNQTGISGTVYFKGDDPYQDYFDFVNNFTSQDLILEYNTVKTFKLSCRMIVSKKKENTQDYRKAEVTFQPNGLWYNEVSAICIPAEHEETDGKTYDYTYAYTYGTGAEVGEIEINSDSHIPSPIKLTIWGECYDPTWAQYVNGVCVASGGMNGLTLLDSQCLVVDSTSPENTIETQDLNGNPLVDVYNRSDFRTDRFIYLRNGVNRIVVSSSAGTDLMYSVEARLTYESV